jgi:alpha-1,3-mannosyltransferase
MRILHVVQHFYPCSGGVEKHIYDLCKNLIKLDHRSDVLCFNTCVYERTKLPNFENIDGINVYRRPYLNLKYYKISPFSLKFLKNYDIIHIHSLGFFSDILVLTKYIHKKPLILSTHGAMFHTKKFLKLKNFYFHCWCRFIARGIDKTIAVSKNDERLFSQITKDITFVPNGIDIGSYQNIKRNIEKYSLLYIGRIAKNKRIDNLIQVVHLLKKEIHNVKLYIIGDDWQGIRKDLENMAKERGLSKNVIFTGRISDKEKFRYLGKAQFFVSASAYEGFGISVLEAMAAGIPVIANNIESFRNFIENGENGFIVDYSKPKEVANLILNLIDKDLSKISKNAKETSKEYDWKEVIKRIEKIYIDLAE